MTRQAPVPQPMRAAYALRRPAGSTTAHLVLGDADRALCGREVGEPAPTVTCTGCASHWAWLPAGRRVVRAARNEINLMLLARTMGAPAPELPRRADALAAAVTAARDALPAELDDAARRLTREPT